MVVHFDEHLRVAAATQALHPLRQALLQPGGRAVLGHLPDKAVREFVLEDARQFGRQDALDGAPEKGAALMAHIDGDIVCPKKGDGDTDHRQDRKHDQGTHDTRRDQFFYRIESEDAYGVDLVTEDHGAQFRCDAGANATREHEGRQHRT